MEMLSIPYIRFNKFDNEWFSKKLDLVSNVTMGQSPDSKNYTDNPNDYILVQGNADMQNGRIVPRVWTTQVTKLAEKGDLILSVRAPVGDVGKTDYNVVLGRGVAAIRGNDFLFYLLSRMKQTNYWAKFSTGSTFESINSSDIKSAEICLPSQEEQTAIGSLFCTLDTLLSSYKDNLVNYQSFKATMLSKMFPKAGQTVPEIRLDGFEGEWENKRADEIFKSVSEKNRALLPVLSASQIDGMVLRDEIGIDIKYDEATLNNYKLVKPGQFVIHLRSFQGGFALSKLEGITSPAYTIIDFIDKANNLPDFWNSILTSRDFIKRLETVTYGIRDGKSISFKDFSSLKFVFPEFKEQQAIGSYFSNLDQLITSYQEKISQLDTLKKKLLQDMFI